jgi:hypothetical protein
MSRRGELWRAEIAQRIGEYLDQQLSAEDLTDWAIDHPFYDDRIDLSEEEQRLIAYGLAVALQVDQIEPVQTRATARQLRAAASALWAGLPVSED